MRFADLICGLSTFSNIIIVVSRRTERQRDSALRKVKLLERQLEEARQLAQLESRQKSRLEGAEHEGAEDNDRRVRLGKLEGENVLLR